MKRFGLMMLGLALITLTTGCQCGRGTCGSCNYGPTMAPAPFGGGGCSSGNCGVGAPTYTPQGAYNTYNTYQSTASAPVIQGSVPTTASAPLDPLPMY
ncbi:hypothetical protein [Gimesia fumaroli]|jgi:hypothetical protein|uniref:Lipoprotein n=1 Tax=Gimesia fumaroli TaxID=2527976 RepID=A0A518IIS1_9PLAN|nr:hypothetical protein [Gimesia fumaroli]QDV52998.1 hypothetical protein Enr17x_50680 [Gimesia fumaroli]